MDGQGPSRHLKGDRFSQSMRCGVEPIHDWVHAEQQLHTMNHPVADGDTLVEDCFGWPVERHAVVVKLDLQALDLDPPHVIRLGDEHADAGVAFSHHTDQADLNAARFAYRGLCESCIAAQKSNIGV